MGVEFRTLLLPRDRSFRPDGAVISRLITAWGVSGFIPTSPLPVTERGGPAWHLPPTVGPKIKTSLTTTDVSLDEVRGICERSAEAIIAWNVHHRRDSRITHPLADIIEDEDSAYYDLELHLSQDFVEPSEGQIRYEQYPASCAKGHALEYHVDPPAKDIFYATRIRDRCSVCGAGYDWNSRRCFYANGDTGEEKELIGGAAYRFAVVINCGKSWATNDARDRAPIARPEFIAASASTLSMQLDELDLYS